MGHVEPYQYALEVEQFTVIIPSFGLPELSIEEPSLMRILIAGALLYLLVAAAIIYIREG